MLSGFISVLICSGWVCSESLAFATEPVLGSLVNLLGNCDRLPVTVQQELKVSTPILTTSISIADLLPVFVKLAITLLCYLFHHYIALQNNTKNIVIVTFWLEIRTQTVQEAKLSLG